ncbi:hypothetical protein [Kitasatospora phosalacinea]|uniref:Uncharacterized protein n=1 Tax=Kitasatospora phosalacinea TaxID=2065 RepID=A0A9W6UP11_9ACTN|nr:hypothetical protein [Kitasatospora phosalacinea]GLW54090.1 hypothetical protein Kpho01_21010 [Kitasatospora phosalacinea]
MNPEEIRERLSGAAESAGPPELDTALLVRRVRRGRLARRALTGGTALALAAAAVLGAVRWSGSGGAVGPAGAADPLRGPYVCGQRLPVEGASATAGGITLSVSAARGAGDGSGPEVTAGFGADRVLTVIGAPPQYLEALYLRDGVVVGGGPLLNAPGDRSVQSGNYAGHRYLLAPGPPLAVPLGARDRLCPSVAWPQVWAEPGRYEVALLVSLPLGEAGAPTQVLVARAPLPQ